jgi:hypothetical protein
MNRSQNMLPTLVTSVLLVAAVIHGPIAQLPHYHEFADQAPRWGIAHFADVASNLGFLLVALLGVVALWPARHHPALLHGRAGYALFLLGLLLTAFGSGYYHLAPDNARLVWDRIPIALACGGLLAGVWGDTHGKSSRELAAASALFGVLGVLWWYHTESAGIGDLRAYLAMQILPFLLIPIWQLSYDAGKSDRWYFGIALLIYAVAKLAELNDHEIGAMLGVTGHTLKHLLAAFSSALIVAGLDRRVRSVAPAAANRVQ